MEAIRLLLATEIECRVSTVTQNGCSLLLYKDARCDMRILDEVYGINGWQRYHEVINGNLFCNVEIWDAEKKCWIRKQDVGTESYTEKEKGQASDSFKRACFNFGIGRELYTAPFIWVNLTSDDLDNKGKVKSQFSVKNIEYNDSREIIGLTITDKKSADRYSIKQPIKTQTPKATTPQAPPIKPQVKPSDDYIQSIMDTLNMSEDLSLITLLGDIKRAKSIAELTMISTSYPQLMVDERFKSSLTHRKNEIKSM